ncbi:hypothetical protein HXX76_012293 [Chlamydomonas incerta]|uniref:Pherophorin domain-containing protein n=1 Tax=Chlamydomonas incerta TaxID=51695 RepID=A0A835SIA4_CHLIN|nr:hypothetical protein HXX76_012293 [Chlamydomonas incerta]|eukprot:KAG2427643.1 hypothetical protein HXX76_012293 [Chlamydomonas incerta]
MAARASLKLLVLWLLFAPYDCSQQLTYYGAGAGTATIYSGTLAPTANCTGNLSGTPITSTCISGLPTSNPGSYWCMAKGAGNASVTVAFSAPLWATMVSVYVADCSGSFIAANMTTLTLANGTRVPVSCPSDLCNGTTCGNTTYWWDCPLPPPLYYVSGMTFWVASATGARVVDAVRVVGYPPPPPPPPPSPSPSPPAAPPPPAPPSPDPPNPPDAPPDPPTPPSPPPTPPAGSLNCSQYDCSTLVTAYGSGMAAWTLYSGQNSTVCTGNLGGAPLSSVCIGANPKSGASYWCMKAGTGNASITVSFTEPLWASQIGIFVADCTGSFILNRTSLRLADGSVASVACPADLCNGVVCKNVAYWYNCTLPRPLSYVTGMTFWIASGSSEKLLDAYDCSTLVTAYGSGMAAWTLYSGQNSTVCTGNLGGAPLSSVCIGANPKSGASYWCMKAGTGNASITVSFTEPLWASQIGIFVADCTGSFILSTCVHGWGRVCCVPALPSDYVTNG